MPTINEDAIDFCNWFAPTWRFYDLDEWENTETGERCSTASLYIKYTESE